MTLLLVAPVVLGVPLVGFVLLRRAGRGIAGAVLGAAILWAFVTGLAIVFGVVGEGTGSGAAAGAVVYLVVMALAARDLMRQALRGGMAPGAHQALRGGMPPEGRQKPVSGRRRLGR